MVESFAQREVALELNIKFAILAIQIEKNQSKLQKLSYLFLRANINDLIQSKVNIKPVINIINFELSAQKFSKGSPRLLKKSRPPRNMIKPKVTTMCISNFFLFGNNKVKIAKSSIGKPNIDGIYEVIELLALK